MSRQSLIHWRNSLLVGLIGAIGLYCAACSWPIILAAGMGIALFSRFLSAKYFILVANKLLHKAARKGNTVTVKGLIALGAEVNARNQDNRTPLHLAAIWGHAETAEALIARGTEVNARDHYNDTPLHWAAFKGHTATVEALIARGAVVNARSNFNQTPLHRAAWRGYTEAMEALIANRANLCALDNSRECPLGIAARWGHASTVSRILAALGETERRRLLAERGEHIITVAFVNGYDEIVTSLQNNYGVRLPERLQNAANGRLNGAQSTHEVSVHESVSQSVLALASSYLPGLSNEEKKALRAWYGSALDDPQRSFYKENAQKLMEQLLKRSSTQGYIKHYTAILQQFCTNLQEQSCEFAEHNALKVTAAKKALARLLNDANYRDFTDSRSGVPMNLALALIYQGVWDKNNTHLVAFSEKGRCEILVQAFYEMQRGYNLNDDGKETNALAADNTICVPGHFNKVISALGGGRHNDVNIIFITKEVARFKVQALIKKHYETVPKEEQTRYFGEIYSTHKLPAHLWNTYLKEPILAELHQEYDSFVKAGMLPQAYLDSAIHVAVNGVLPGYVLEVMLYSARLAEEIDEETQAAIIGRYDLYFKKEEPFMLPEYIAQGKQRAEELGVELSSPFCWTERRQVLTSKTQAKTILKYFANQVKRTSSSSVTLVENEPTPTGVPHSLP